MGMFPQDGYFTCFVSLKVQQFTRHFSSSKIEENANFFQDKVAANFRKQKLEISQK